MIAMQYKMVLPADYPMESIENRIREKGHLLDGYPGLLFKAYLYSRKDATTYHNDVNSYAPFYVWRDHDSMRAFLNSDGFNGLCEQFGRPAVQVWFVDEVPNAPDENVVFACIEHTALQDADVRGVNVTTWQTLGVTWLSQIDNRSPIQGDLYAVGYVARGC